MKKELLTITLLLILFCKLNYAGSFNTFDSSEVAAVKKIIIESYIEALFHKGDPELIKKGWHPECDILINENGMLKRHTPSKWIERFTNNPKPFDPNAKYSFTDVKVTHYAAMAIVEIYSSGKHIYTDYLNLYKLNSEWKIVAKIFFPHPKN